MKEKVISDIKDEVAKGKSKDNFYYKSNRLQQLRGFYYAAMYNSISKAADTMNLNQSTVTMQIKSLEASLGAQLFDRNGPVLRVNAQGETLFQLIEPHVLGLDKVYREFNTQEKLRKEKQITIASQHMASLYITPSVIEKFQAQFPKVHINIINCNPQDGIDLLEKKQASLVIGSYYDVPKFLRFHSLVSFEPVLICHKDHPLAKEKNITMDIIREHDFATITESGFTIPNFESVVKQYGIKPKINLVHGDLAIEKVYAKRNIACAIIQGICLEPKDYEELFVFPLTEYFPKVPYGYLTTRDKLLSPTEEAFINCLTTEYK